MFTHMYIYVYIYMYAYACVCILHIHICIYVYETRIYGRRVTLPYYRPSSAVYVNEHIYNAPLQLHRRGVALPYHW